MSETNFTKLFSSITASTIWSESAETKVVWITMLAMSDGAGFVYASVPGLAKISGVSMEGTIDALKLLMSPDKWSRDKDNEGRRIEEIDGGWAILNHPKYRKRRDAEERKAYHREYMRLRRLAKSVKSGVNNVKDCEPQSTQAEAEAEVDKKKNGRFAPPSLDQVKEFIQKKEYHISGESFIAHYESNGWMVGKNKMKDWQAAVRGWEARDKSNGRSNASDYEGGV